MALTQGHIAKVKVTIDTWQKYLFSDHYLSRVTWMILHTIVVHDRGFVVAGVIFPLEHVYFCLKSSIFSFGSIAKLNQGPVLYEEHCFQRMERYEKRLFIPMVNCGKPLLL